MKIALITNFNINEKASSAFKVGEYLYKLGCQIYISQFSKERVQSIKQYEDINPTFIHSDKIYQEVDFVVALGGDGTILDSARRASNYKVPVLGINLGHLGYLAEIEMSEIDLLKKVVEGDYSIDEREMLKVEVFSPKGVRKSAGNALNDAVISNGSVARIIDLELYENDSLITNYRADGLIVATPTGSTAYSMSAGGAIADPRVKCICVTPICPHSLGARPIVFPSDAKIEIKNTCIREKNLYLTIDGRSNFEIFKDDVVKISKSDATAKLVRLKEKSFCEKLRQKMKNTF